MAKKTPSSSSVETVNATPWVERFRPKSIKEMALPVAKVSGQRVDLANELQSFIKSFFVEIQKINQENKAIRAYNRTVTSKDQKEELKISPTKAAVLLEGPPGIGKTSIVYALANDLNMEVIETNASDTRTRGALEEKLKETTKSRGIMDFVTQSRKKLILIDEIDGIHGNQDRGAVPTIIDLIENTQFPIIMCSNEYKQNLQSLYKTVRRFEVHPLSKKEVEKIIHSILAKEKKSITPDILNLIIEKNHGDLRGIINDLQGISQGISQINDKDLVNSLTRDSTEEIFNLIRQLFQEVFSLSQARDLTNKADVDYNFLYKWVHENIPSFLKLSSELQEAYENLSIADEIFGRIRKNMYWALLPYFYDLFAGGVVLAQKGKRPKGFAKISNPEFIRTSSLTATEQGISEKIKIHYDISQFEIMQDFLPFLKVFCNASRKNVKIVSDFLELDAKEKKKLTK